MKCPRCATLHTGSALFCRQCGYSYAGQNEIACDTHEEAPAIGVCVVCGKPVCGDCSVTAARKIYCDDPTHVSLDATCVLFGTSTTLFDAELVARNLSANGVEVHTFFPQVFSFFGSLTDDLRPKVYVESDRRNTAISLIEDLDLRDFITIITD